MTMTEIFEAMPARLNTAVAAGLDKTVQWNITGEEPGVWAIQVADGAAHLIPGGVEKPDVTFTIKSQDWLAIAEGKLNPMNALKEKKPVPGLTSRLRKRWPCSIRLFKYLTCRSSTDAGRTPPALISAMALG